MYACERKGVATCVWCHNGMCKSQAMPKESFSSHCASWVHLFWIHAKHVRGSAS